MREPNFCDSDTSVPEKAASARGSDTPSIPESGRDRSQSPPVLEEGTWLSAGGGLLTAQTRPADKDAVAKWGADVVVVLRDADDKFDIVQAAVSVQMLRHSRQFKLPRQHVFTPTSIQPFTAAVRYAYKWLGKGYRAAVVNDRGWRRTGAVAYALLRCEPGFSAFGTRGCNSVQ